MEIAISLALVLWGCLYLNGIISRNEPRFRIIKKHRHTDDGYVDKWYIREKDIFGFYTKATIYHRYGLDNSGVAEIDYSSKKLAEKVKRSFESGKRKTGKVEWQHPEL